MSDLYIIHGWTYTTAHWEKTLSLLDASGFKIKMLKVPGLTSPSEKVWTIDDYAAWADKNIPDGAVALGHSNGGRILLNLCAKNPAKLEKLILLDSAGVYEPSIRKNVVKFLAKIGKPLKKIPVFDHLFHKFTGSTDYEKAPENMKRTLENMLESDKSLKLAKVTTKTAILWGKSDKVTPPRHAEKLHAALKNSSLKFYQNWTHAPYISDPITLAKAIERELNNV